MALTPQAADLAGKGLDVGGLLIGDLAAGIAARRKGKRIRRQLSDVEIAALDDALFEATQLGDPTKLQAIAIENPEILNYVEDPVVRQAIGAGIEGLTRAAQEGILPAEQAVAEAAMMPAGIAARGAREAAQQQAQAKGIGGSGMMQARQMAANQAATNRMFGIGADFGMEDIRRRQQAGTQAAQLGIQRAGQQFRQKQGMSDAQQRLREFNAMNRMNVGQFNIQQQQQANLTRAGFQEQARRDKAQEAQQKRGMEYEKEMQRALV